jgi:hypothetical protein
MRGGRCHKVRIYLSTIQREGNPPGQDRQRTHEPSMTRPLVTFGASLARAGHADRASSTTMASHAS